MVTSTDLCRYETEDIVFPELLDAALACLTEELRADGYQLSRDPLPGRKSPPLHARLRLNLSSDNEDEMHWAFRAMLAHNAIAAQNRVRNAHLARDDPGQRTTAADPAPQRPWPNGQQTLRSCRQFETAGGVCQPLDDRDLRVFGALQMLVRQDPPGLRDWRGPASASSTGLLRAAVLTGLPPTRSRTDDSNGPDSGPRPPVHHRTDPRSLLPGAHRGSGFTPNGAHPGVGAHPRTGAHPGVGATPEPVPTPEPSWATAATSEAGSSPATASPAAGVEHRGPRPLSLRCGVRRRCRFLGRRNRYRRLLAPSGWAAT